MRFNYILSNESINSKGFIVETAGIDLESFSKNPVALKNHNIDNVIGHWENVRINEDNPEQLIGTVVFDYNDPEAQKLMNQVAQNLVKHVSIGINILEFYDDIIDDEDVIVITKSELIEGSITPLPANKDAIKLTYNGDTVLDLEEFTIKNKNNMSKVLELTTENADLKNQLETAKTNIEVAAEKEAEFTDAISEKEKEIEELKAKSAELQARLDAIKEAEAKEVFNKLLEDGIEEGKIKESQKETFLKLSYESAKEIIDSLESKINVTTPEVKLTDEIVKDTKVEDEKDYRWYEKNDPQALKLMYVNDREKHDRLEKAFYGTK